MDSLIKTLQRFVCADIMYGVLKPFGDSVHRELEHVRCHVQGADLQSPTMFVTHFIDVSHCNDFSLARDDERWPAYNDLFLEIYRLSRCKLSVVRCKLWQPFHENHHQVVGG